MEEINYRLQDQSAPIPTAIMAIRDPRNPSDINSWNQNVQILPEKAIISNSEPSGVGGVGMVGGGGVGNSNIRGAGKQKPYACTYCEKKFSHVHLMKQHVRIHTGEKPFACKYCEKRFTQSHSVKGHELIHTGEKPFSCKSCSYRCRNMANLKKHEIIHTGEKPFSCKYCDKKFSTKQGLKTHEKSKMHQGPAPPVIPSGIPSNNL